MCTALAREPPTKYGTPSFSSASATSNITATGSGTTTSFHRRHGAVGKGGELRAEEEIGKTSLNLPG